MIRAIRRMWHRYLETLRGRLNRHYSDHAVAQFWMLTNDTAASWRIWYAIDAVNSYTGTPTPDLIKYAVRQLATGSSVDSVIASLPTKRNRPGKPRPART